MNLKPLFAQVPRPWRYDSKTCNVLAADGQIVCRCGDGVYADPLIGPAIVEWSSDHGRPPAWLDEALNSGDGTYKP